MLSFRSATAKRFYLCSVKTVQGNSFKLRVTCKGFVFETSQYGNINIGFVIAANVLFFTLSIFLNNRGCIDDFVIIGVQE